MIKKLNDRGFVVTLLSPIAIGYTWVYSNSEL